MAFLRAISRVLSILAIVSIVLSPVTAPAAGDARAFGSTKATAAVVTMDEGMPCCPPDGPPPPDCAKACPLATACVSKCMGHVAAASAPPVRLALDRRIGLRDDAVPVGLKPDPLPHPPKS